MPYKFLFLTFVFLGSIITAQKVIDFSDNMLFALAIPNVLGCVLLSGKVKKHLDEYWGKYKRGELEPPQST